MGGVDVRPGVEDAVVDLVEVVAGEIIPVAESVICVMQQTIMHGIAQYIQHQNEKGID